MVWNMRYRKGELGKTLKPVTHEEIWQRVEWFLNELVPVAEEVGIQLAAHPDDPPLPYVHEQAKLIHRPEHFQKLIDLIPSQSNGLEFCLGTLAEMQGSDGELLYRTIEEIVSQHKVAYIHLRNVIGTMPNYIETFIDDGRIDIARVFRILNKHNFQGVIIPDHAPSMSTPAPWHSGMAFAMGYIKAMLQQIESNK
jgi:mannonate dehydratase